MAGADSKDKQDKRWAVCPAIDWNGSAPGQDGNPRKPHIFPNVDDAQVFLNAETPYQGKTTSVLAAQGGQVAARGLILRNRNQGWDNPVLLATVSSFPTVSRRSVRAYLRIGTLDSVRPISPDEALGLFLEGRTGDYACCLDDDWRFEEIEADAWWRPGHSFADHNHETIGRIIVASVYDLEDALRRFHPDASDPSIANYWRSWQVHHHIAVLCGRVAESETGRILAGKRYKAVERMKEARTSAYRLLAQFAHEIEIERAPEANPMEAGPNPDGSSKEDVGPAVNASVAGGGLARVLYVEPADRLPQMRAVEPEPAPAVGPDFADPEVRAAARESLKARFGSLKKFCVSERIDYSEFCKWVRDRGNGWAKGQSSRTSRIESAVLKYLT